MFARIYLAAAVAACTAMCATGVAAAPFSAEYVFGDSLSDNGNLAEAFYRQNFPNPPSYHDAFTNGPVAAQVLANSFGLSLTPSLFLTGFKDLFGLFGGASYVPGTNYAVAGATAAATPGFGGIPGGNLSDQVAAFSSHLSGQADQNALYVVMIGGNDIRQAALKGLGVSGITPGVNNEINSIRGLAEIGARNILVVNVSNVGLIPEFAQDHPTQAAAATLLTQQYDSQLAAGINGIAFSSDTKVTLFDSYNSYANLLLNSGSYGITNTTDRCYTNTPLSPIPTIACGPNGANINQFAYWDAIHPTAVVQGLLGTELERALAVPEPGTIALFMIGVAGLLVKGRDRSKALSMSAVNT